MFDIPLTEAQLTWIENNIATRAARDLVDVIRSLRDGTESEVDERMARQCLHAETNSMLCIVREHLYKSIDYYRGV